jgi:hypothetical protein
MLSEDEIKAL